MVRTGSSLSNPMRLCMTTLEKQMILATLHLPERAYTSWATRGVMLPKNDKSATDFVFTSPYARIRKDDKGLYILSHGKRVPVTLSVWKE